MSAIVSFPSAAARERTKRSRLATYLRELADLIEADEVEIEPTAALVVISGPSAHEVVCCGYDDDDDGFQEAAAVAGYVARSDWCRTLGGNRRKRGDYFGRPMKHHNIVDGDFPRPARASQPEPSQ